MKWEPITQSELEELIDAELAEADDEVLAVWNATRIPPTKWSCPPMGDLGEGFWVVAIHEGTVLWYNDIEDGFNESPLVQEGTISEYGCNQDDLALCLRRMTAMPPSDGMPRQGGVVDVPAALSSAGNIVRRQTSYWTLQPVVGPPWRVYFKGKVESNFAGPEFTSVSVLSDHLLLADHNEPWETLYFRGTPREPEVLLAKARASVAAISAGWRNLDQYLNRDAPLTGGYGALLSAPALLTSSIARLLNADGCQTSLCPFRHTSERGGFKVCVLDRSYVIAREFRFAPLVQGLPS